MWVLSREKAGNLACRDDNRLPKQQVIYSQLCESRLRLRYKDEMKDRKETADGIGTQLSRDYRPGEGSCNMNQASIRGCKTEGEEWVTGEGRGVGGRERERER